MRVSHILTIFKKVNASFYSFTNPSLLQPEALLAHCPLLVCLQASRGAESHLLRAYCVDTAAPCNAKDSKGPLNPSEKRHRLLKQENKYTPNVPNRLTNIVLPGHFIF